MDPALVVELRQANETREQALELTAQLRAAAADGDDDRMTRLLARLLRFKGLTHGQRVRLQMKALASLVQTLRAMVVHDAVTGLLNRHGFMQCGTRLLDLATQEKQPHHLIRLQLAPLPPVTDATLHLIPVRRVANLMRDLFPGHGVYEVLGRLSASQFAALTPASEYAARDSLVLRPHSAGSSGSPPAVRLSVGIAHFDPLRPVGLDELLEKAELSMHSSGSRALRHPG